MQCIEEGSEVGRGRVELEDESLVVFLENVHDGVSFLEEVHGNTSRPQLRLDSRFVQSDTKLSDKESLWSMVQAYEYYI